MLLFREVNGKELLNHTNTKFWRGAVKSRETNLYFNNKSMHKEINV